MTDVTFIGQPLKGGHGLTKIASELYEPTALGEPTDAFPAIVMLRAHGASTKPIEDGHAQNVKLLITKCEPVIDPEQAGELMCLLQALREERTSVSGQRVLPIAFPGDKKLDREKAAIWIERIEHQWDRLGWTGAEGEANWRSHFGIGPGEENSYGDRGVPGDYRIAAVAWLTQYAGSIGLLDDATNGSKDDAPATIPLDLDGTGEDPDAADKTDDEDENGDAE